MLLQMLLALAMSVEARISPSFSRRSSHPNGVATFNDYSGQATTVCGPMVGQPGTYGAAASDISPHISGGKCSGTIDMSNCYGQSPINGVGPSCPKTNCGKCYKVTNQGGIPVGKAVGGIGNSVVVQIIDACPHSNPQNYCKTDSAANQRCMDPNTNQLDIDRSAYEALTGQAFDNGPNLQILIEDFDCSGPMSGGTVASSSSEAKPVNPSAASSASVLAATLAPASSPTPEPAASSVQPTSSSRAPSPPTQSFTGSVVISKPHTNDNPSSGSSPLQPKPIQGLEQTPATGAQVYQYNAVPEADEACFDEDVSTS